MREGALGDRDEEALATELVEHLSGRVARWWLPDEFAFIEEVPKTSVGKFDKKELRRRLEGGELGRRVMVERPSASSRGESATAGAA